MQLENDSKIEFEHDHVRTRNDEEELGCNCEKQLMFECDSIAKEARIKFNDKEIIDTVQVRGNLSQKHENTHCDKK